MPIVKKIHRLERAQHAFLDHSKALVFSDVIKNSHARAIRTYSLARQKSVTRKEKEGELVLQPSLPVPL